LGGESVGHVLSFRDITAERRRAEEALRKSEEQLRQAQKMEAIGKLAGGVAHDFNNLLTAITGFSDLVLARMEPDSPLRAYVLEIAKAGERATALTSQLLAFGRRQVLQPTVLSLSSTVSDMSRLLQRIIGEDISLTTDVAPDLWLVRADPGQIGQVILNLATNARDAMPRGGDLTIQAANVSLDEADARRRGMLPGGYVVLRVADTGVGISREILPHIFEPFFTTKGVGKGTGLGLSTVYGIVKQSGGEVEVSSKPHQGTTFAIYLPRYAAAPEAAQVQPDAVSPPLATAIDGSETLLLVEDEGPVRALATVVLESSGHKVLAVSSGEEALGVCRRYEGPIHLLLTDIVMPGMNGIQLSKHVMELRPDIKVLYMSGFVDSEALPERVGSEDSGFLQKPFTAAILTSKVRAALDGVLSA
jgi:nitrogen-specific signal transduction histidine kinase